MSYDFYDSLKMICEKRKSIRDFMQKPIEQEKIDQIIHIAKTSPFASGRKNWDILTVSDTVIQKKMAEMIQKKATELEAEMIDDFKMSFHNYSKNFVVFQSAPVLLIPTFRISYSVSMMMKDQNNHKVSQWERDNFLQSISCVSMLILLAAQSLNLGACYMTGPLIAEEELNVLLKPKPEHKLGAIIPLGYY